VSLLSDHLPRKSPFAELFTFIPDGHIFSDQQPWDPLQGRSSVRHLPSKEEISRGAAYLARKILAPTHDFIADEVRISHAMTEEEHLAQGLA
jgi:hypothetical protein